MARVALGAALALLLAAQAASCVSLYDLEGYGAAVSQLCERISVCYGGDYYPDCLARAGARLEAAAPAERQLFLNTFADKSCLENCTNAKACLDAVPICGPSTTSCAVEPHCCGFWQQGAVCEETACCSPRGVACGDDAECCGDVRCIERDGRKTCGGVECAERDQPCVSKGDCCGTLLCSPITSTCTNCVDDGLPCSASGECCNGFCDPNLLAAPEGDAVDPAMGLCATPSCGLPGQECQSRDDCCPDSFCVPLPGFGVSICNADECLPEAFPCTEARQCCSGVCNTELGQCVPPAGCQFGLGEACDTTNELSCCDGFCDKAEARCCRYGGSPCFGPDECCDGACLVIDATMGFSICVPNNPQCAPDGSGCGEDGECCSHRCDESSASCCPPTSTGCAHGVCDQGEALDPGCSELTVPAGAPEAPGADIQRSLYGNPGCIAAICATNGYAYCCCDYWDQECVLLAIALDEECDAGCGVDGMTGM